MVEYLKTKKGYFYKIKKNGEKKRISQKEYYIKSKTRKNKKMIGGMYNIKEITENNKETEFEQKHAVINYGIGPISTYNLVNCIAIGGVFTSLSGKDGTFLTHESPIDYREQISKLIKIKTILDKKNATIIKIVIFRIDEPAKDIYNDDLTTTDIINLMINFSSNLFHLTPNIINYSCDNSTMRCGKAIISPTRHDSELTKIRLDFDVTPTSLVKPSETFIVEVLHNNYGEKIYECPICKSKSGSHAPKNPTNTSLFSHKFNCPNKNKIPIEA
jgi:hypothetical protein